MTPLLDDAGRTVVAGRSFGGLSAVCRPERPTFWLCTKPVKRIVLVASSHHPPEGSHYRLKTGALCAREDAYRTGSRRA
ncbi:hypothetical protein KCP78_01535 [Salmonella enterica subsp. enterica]|nr:hypothetical protein KCP78_01535 [Salmonella enterica subsp. enterica]